jgi:hypothetical protein
VGRYPAGYPRRPVGGLIRLSWFPAAFRRPAFASWPSCARPAIGVPYGRPTEPNLGLGAGRGCHVPHTRDTTGMGALCTPGTTVLTPDRSDSPAGVCRISAARPCTPPPALHRGEVALHEASTRVHAIHPSGLPLACGRPDGSSRPWALPRASHPAITRDARRGGDRPTEHVPGTTAQLTSVDLQSSSSLNVCDLTSHVAMRASGCVDLVNESSSARRSTSPQASARSWFAGARPADG